MGAMLMRLDPSRLLRYAGLFTWAVVALPLLVLAREAPALVDAELDPAMPTVGWGVWLVWGAFGLCYGWLTRRLGRRRVRAVDYVLLLLLNASAIAVSTLAGWPRNVSGSSPEPAMVSA